MIERRIEIEFKKATTEDICSIMSIIEQAQEYFRKNEIDQWQNNYPNIDTIKTDIDLHNCYVLLHENTIVGTVVLNFGVEKNYERILNGAWINEGPYAVIHRIAIDHRYKGLGLSAVIIKRLEEICSEKEVHSIRVDTHYDNLPMKKFLVKNGFQYCGIIYLEDDSERIAFEKSI